MSIRATVKGVRGQSRARRICEIVRRWVSQKGAQPALLLTTRLTPSRDCSALLHGVAAEEREKRRRARHSARVEQERAKTTRREGRAERRRGEEAQRTRKEGGRAMELLLLLLLWCLVVRCPHTNCFWFVGVVVGWGWLLFDRRKMKEWKEECAQRCQSNHHIPRSEGSAARGRDDDIRNEEGRKEGGGTRSEGE